MIFENTSSLHYCKQISNCESGFLAAIVTAMPYEEIEVECYSGYRANERPLAFIFEDRRWQVAEIIDRWYEGGLHPKEPALDYFKVRTTEGRIFLLRYNSLFDAWAIRVPPKTAH